MTVITPLSYMKIDNHVQKHDILTSTKQDQQIEDNVWTGYSFWLCLSDYIVH